MPKIYLGRFRAISHQNRLKRSGSIGPRNTDTYYIYTLNPLGAYANTNCLKQKPLFEAEVFASAQTTV